VTTAGLPIRPTGRRATWSARAPLLGLHRARHIELPPARLKGFNPAARYSRERWKAVAAELDTDPAGGTAECPPAAGVPSSAPHIGGAVL